MTCLTAREPRTAAVSRATRETSISVTLDLDGAGTANVSTGVGFFDHMLTALGRHGLFGLEVQATGDTQVDDHHTVEDVGIVLGQAFRAALGDARGVTRYGSAHIPMDEALVMCAVDLSGRGQAHCDLRIPTERIGTFDSQLVKEFLIAFASNAGVTVHVRTLAGENSHHIVEAAFKALARALMQAVSLDLRVTDIPSTKGCL